MSAPNAVSSSARRTAATLWKPRSDPLPTQDRHAASPCRVPQRVRRRRRVGIHRCLGGFGDELTSQGLRPPLLVISDGAAGLLAAVETASQPASGSGV